MYSCGSELYNNFLKLFGRAAFLQWWINDEIEEANFKESYHFWQYYLSEIELNEKFVGQLRKDKYCNLKGENFSDDNELDDNFDGNFDFDE